MTDSNYSSAELNVDLDEVDYVTDRANQAADEYQRALERQQESQGQLEDAERVSKEVQDDPRNADNWGAKALIKEGQSILSGGLQDTASSLATFPERTVDALSGAMQRERQETGRYKPDWSPFGAYDNPIETKTWWGKQLRGLVHFGTLAAGTVVAAKAAVATGAGTIPAGLLTLSKANLVRGAAVGAVSDLISKESDEQNALAALRDRFGWIDTPISTKDTDHPVVMKLKNIVEGMGIGLIFDGFAYTLKKGGDKAIEQITKRNKSLENQTVQAG